MSQKLGKRKLPYLDRETEKWNRYEDYVVSQGFQIYNITGDGNCLFRAVAHQLKGDDSQFASYRQIAVDYMKLYPERFSFNLRKDQDGSFEQYLKNMEKDGVWGGYLELYALSQALKVQIWLFQESLSVLKIGSPEYDENGSLLNKDLGKRQILYLIYNRSSRHYNSVVQNSQMEIESSNSRIIRKVTKEQDKTQKKFEQNSNQDFQIDPPKKKKIIKNKIIREIEKPVLCCKCGETFKESCKNKENNEKIVNFKEIFLLDNKEIIQWCLNVNLLQKPSNCKSCRNKTGKFIDVRLSGNKNYLDFFV